MMKGCLFVLEHIAEVLKAHGILPVVKALLSTRRVFAADCVLYYDLQWWHLVLATHQLGQLT